jgi:UDP-N-acetylmuramoylalanine--D-glutamate ligase
VEFWNDSASTIPHATAAAVQAFQIPNSKFQIPVILIAGGRQKVNDYSSLAKALREYPPEYVVLIGENKRTLSRLIKRQATRDKRQGKCDVVLASDLKDAIQKAHTFARSLHVAYPMSRVAIVFSPGAASFDMFPNYAARGRQFKKLVRELKV